MTTQAFNLSQFANFLNSSGQVSYSGIQSGVVIASGTSMLFQQTSAPVGWTKVTSYNNYAIRIVSGSASTGGTVAFTTAFSSQAISGTVSTTGATTLSTAQLASHAHNTVMATGQCSFGGSWVGGCGNATTFTTQSSGGGGSHSHTGGTFTGSINLAVQYVDVILATKN